MKKEITESRELGVIAESFAGVGQPFPAYFHEELVIGLMIQGSRFLQLPGQRALIGPGSLFLIPSLTAHVCTSLGQSESAWITTHLQMDWRPACGVLEDRDLAARFAGLPLAQVALRTGFSDQAHFTNMFMRSIGMTPANWRRQKKGRQ